MRNKIWGLLLALLTLAWFAVILYFGSEKGQRSHGRSSTLTTWIMDTVCEVTHWKLSPKARAWRERKLNFNLRELAHGTEFLIGAALLTLLLQRLLRHKEKAGSTALYLCLLYATLDEIHQIFIPGRSFLFKEIAMDFLGAYWGVMLAGRLHPAPPALSPELSRPAANSESSTPHA